MDLSRFWALCLGLALLPCSAFASGNAVTISSPQQHLVIRVGQDGTTATIPGQGNLEFHLQSIVVGGERIPLTLGKPTVSGTRVTQALGAGVTVWYVSGLWGIEQGFTLARPLGGSMISLDLDLAGDLVPRRTTKGLRFIAATRSRFALQYDHFSAYDADHHPLPAHLSLQGRRLSLRVDARGARYPVILDPLLSSEPVLLATPDGIAPYQIASSADGHVVIVGAPEARTQAGEAYVFVKSGNTWVGPATIPNPGSTPTYFGKSVAMSADGKTAAVGAPGNNPNVYVFTQNGGSWTLAATMSTAGIDTPGQVAFSKFGYAVALSGDGHTLLTGAAAAHSLAGAAYVYTGIGSTWSGPIALTMSSISSTAYAGSNVALSLDGKIAVVSAPDDRTYAGAIYVYTYDGSNWSGPLLLDNPLTGTSNAGLGLDMTMSGDGNVILARANATSLTGTWVFAYASGTGGWSAPVFVSSNSSNFFFQHTMALSSDGTKAIIGAPGSSTGAADVYTRSGATWSGPVAMSQAGQGSNRILGAAAALSTDGQTAFVGAVGNNPIFVYSSTVQVNLSASQPPALMLPESQVTLTFTVDNADTQATATTLTLKDELPAGAVYQSSNPDSGQCSYASATGTVTCTLASLAPGAQPWQPSIVFTSPVVGGPFTNNASISADQALSGVVAVETDLNNDTAPVANDGSLMAFTGVGANSSLSATPGFPGQILSYSLIDGPTHGHVTLNSSTGKFTYTSTVGYIGTDSFSFNAGDSIITSNQATESVTVSDAVPVASNGSFTASLKTPTSGTLNAKPGFVGQTLTYMLVRKPAHGTVVLDASTGHFTYTSRAYIGKDSFTFRVGDGVVTSNQASETVTVTLPRRRT